MPDLGWLGSQEALITLLLIPLAGWLVRRLMHSPHVIAESYEEVVNGDQLLFVRVWNQAHSAGLWQTLIGQRQDAEECRVKMQIFERDGSEPVSVIDERHSVTMERRLLTNLPATLYKDNAAIFQVIRQARAKREDREQGALYRDTMFDGVTLEDRRDYCFHLIICFRTGSGRFFTCQTVKVGDSLNPTVWGTTCR